MRVGDGLEYSPACVGAEKGPVRSGFHIQVINIENMVAPKNVVVKLDFCETNLGSSQGVPVQKSEAQVNWEIFYDLPIPAEQFVYDLTANPFLFTVLYQDTSITSTAVPEKEVVETTKGKALKSKSASSKEAVKRERSSGNASKKSGKSRSSRKKSPARENSPGNTAESFETLGVASLDIMPLLVGSEGIREVLWVHTLTEQRGSKGVAWSNLPKLQVSITATESVRNILQENITNILHFTLETTHNVSEHFNENTQVASIFPQNQEFEVVKFTNCSLISDSSTWISKRKKWRGLSSLRGQGALSSYMVCDNIFDLSNTTDYEITRSTLDLVPKVQWFQLHRVPLNTVSQQLLKDKLIKYGCWPVEIVTFGGPLQRQDTPDTKTKSGKKGPKVASDHGGKKPPEKDLENISGHFIAFLDLSKLLYPGVTSVRVASQLFMYTEEATKVRFGSEHHMFVPPRPPTAVKTVKPPKSPTSTVAMKGRSRPSTASTKKNVPEVELTVVEEEPPMPDEPEPVLDEKGDPTFVIVQVQLSKPLIEKRIPEEVLESIQSIAPFRPPPTDAERAKINSTLAFQACIRDLTSAIHKEYQMFETTNEQSFSEKICKHFLMHLHMTGAYMKMREAMTETVRAYIYDSMGLQNFEENDSVECQNTLSAVYTALVDKMCTIVNKSSSCDVSDYDPQVTCNDLLYFSMEAMEEGNHDKSQEYLLQRLNACDKLKPQFWVDYAVFLVKRMEYEKAGECVREAISLDSKYIPALFVHGLLSWLTEDFCTAEMFLLAVVAFDPHSLEGWTALYIFHKQMDSQLDANAELLNAKLCIKEDFVPLKPDSHPKLSWCPGLAGSDRIFLLTAMKMIRFSFPELAELALSYDLLQFGRSTEYLYYLAVCHYQQDRHADSLQHLKEALKSAWEAPWLWALKGHNYYKLNLGNEAKEAFQFALNCPDIPNHCHLVQLRLGNLLVREGDHTQARDCFKKVCKFSPTPLAWLGLGITAFMDDEIKDAELALSEANLLDGRMSEVWGYLALVNVMLARPSVYSQCLSQALRYGLDDPVLLERLKILGQFAQTTDDFENYEQSS